MVITIFVIGSLLFIGLLAAAATWEQKRRGTREDDHREVMGGTRDDPGSGLPPPLR